VLLGGKKQESGKTKSPTALRLGRVKEKGGMGLRKDDERKESRGSKVSTLYVAGLRTQRKERSRRRGDKEELYRYCLSGRKKLGRKNGGGSPRKGISFPLKDSRIQHEKEVPLSDIQI